MWNLSFIYLVIRHVNQLFGHNILCIASQGDKGQGGSKHARTELCLSFSLPSVGWFENDIIEPCNLPGVLKNNSPFGVIDIHGHYSQLYHKVKARELNNKWQHNMNIKFFSQIKRNVSLKVICYCTNLLNVVYSFPNKIGRIFCTWCKG